MENPIKKQNYNYQDKNWINKFFKLVICCAAAIGIRYLFESKNLHTSDFVFSIIFGTAIWIMLIFQKKI